MVCLAEAKWRIVVPAAPVLRHKSTVSGSAYFSLVKILVDLSLKYVLALASSTIKKRPHIGIGWRL